jgi:peptidyl-prolyl cis-trans isomerase A (cyclophilin A)
MKWIISVSFLLLISCGSQHNTKPEIVIETAYGDIILELYADKAPKTVKAFLSYVDEDLYKKGSFYRVLNNDNQPSNAPKSELIQGGIWKSNIGKAASIKGIEHEPTNITGVLHKRGVISLARTTPGTASTEFFICIADEPGLDFGGENIADKQGYAAFGKIIKGMDIALKIYRQNEVNQYFDPPVTIFSIKRN